MLGRVYSHASSSPLLPGCDKQASPRMKHEFVSIMACPDWFFSMLSMYKSCWGRASRCFQCEKPRLPVDFLVSTAIGSRMDKIGTWFNFLDTSKTSLWVNKNEKNMTENGGSMSSTYSTGIGDHVTASLPRMKIWHRQELWWNGWLVLGLDAHSVWGSMWKKTFPIGSMYGIYANIWGILMGSMLPI